MATEKVMTPGQIMAEARRQTGLAAQDDPALDPPLEVLCKALATESDLNDYGVQYWNQRLINIAMTRLRAHNWFTRHPEILDEQIKSPIVVLGMSRTGTTLLQRLIASDSRTYSAAWWEVRFPVPADDDVRGDKRIAVAKAEVAAILESAPWLASIHPWDAMGADEDIMLVDQTLYSTTTECTVYVPSYREWLRKQDMRPAYAYWKKLLQFLQWQKRQRGVTGERWVLKTPMHLGFVELITELFPDARFIQTHRDPLEFVPSYASMLYSLWQGVSNSANANEAGRIASLNLEQELNHCMAVRDTMPPEHFVDVFFKDTVSDPIGVVERVYKQFGIPMTAQARAEAEAYMARNPREKRPPHNYTIEQFGLTEADLKKRFAKYRARHLGLTS
jgi:hypothetical protein